MNNDLTYYESYFKKIARKLESKYSVKYQLEFSTGIRLDSAVLKIQKKNWKNKTENKISKSSIFFSIWLEEKGIRKNQIFYNIHAFKLRELKGYKIESREFAFSFRNRFEKCKHKWQNVSTDYGPLTLMQGWMEVDLNEFKKDVLKLTDQFTDIVLVIDELLKERKL